MDEVRFADRSAAGRLLGRQLVGLAPTDPVVLALPRGGVPVAYEVASALDAPWDVLVVRKVGVPGQEELAMGAVAEDGIVIRNEDVLRLVAVSESVFEVGADRARDELTKRVAEFREGRPPLDIADKTAIIVDDGLATGATARAAIDVCRARRAAQVWLAVPVAPREVVPMFEAQADRFVVLRTPRFFLAVGAWYDDFTQISSNEVGRLLGH